MAKQSYQHAGEQGNRNGYEVREFARLVRDRKDEEARRLYRGASPETQEAIRTNRVSRLWFKALSYNVSA